MSEKYSEEYREIIEIDAMRSLSEASGITEVYFIQESGMRAIKIGISGGMENRMSMMLSNTPHDLSLLATIRCDHRFEHWLHNKFGESHIRGEWFRPTDDLISFICNDLPKLDEIRPAIATKYFVTPQDGHGSERTAGSMIDAAKIWETVWNGSVQIRDRNAPYYVFPGFLKKALNSLKAFERKPNRPRRAYPV